MRLGWVVLVGVSACSAAVERDAGIDAGRQDEWNCRMAWFPDSRPSDPCAALTEQSCEVSPDCSPIYGLRSTSPDASSATREYAGCTGAIACGFLITWARPPDAGGECWRFGCASVPSGWLSTHFVDETEPLCPFRYECR